MKAWNLGTKVAEYLQDGSFALETCLHQLVNIRVIGFEGQLLDDAPWFRRHVSIYGKICASESAASQLSQRQVTIIEKNIQVFGHLSLPPLSSLKWSDCAANKN